MLDVRIYGTGPIGNNYAEILSNHPGIASIEQLGSSDAPKNPADVAITAVPPGEAGPLVEQNIGECELVLDPSGDGRLPTSEEYKKWYGQDHPAPHTLPATYGSPEYFFREINGSSYTSVPGCYPTASLLPARPLIDGGLVVPDSTMIVDALSGYSGGGKKALELGEYEDIEPYDIGRKHRHVGEMEQFTGNHEVIFNPSVIRNIRYGLLSTVKLELVDDATAIDVQRKLTEAYGLEPFVKVLGLDAKPPTQHAAVGTDLCIISTEIAGGYAILSSAIDNTRKGGASQGVECINIRFGFDRTAGLTPKSEVF